MREDIDSILAEKGADALLLYSDSIVGVNMYYLTKFLAPDPFILFKKVDAEPVIVIKQMEYPRAQKEALVKDVRSYADYDFKAKVSSTSDPELGVLKFIATVARKELGLGTRIFVPSNFPTMVADALRNDGLTLVPAFGVIEKARETKDRNEVNAIKTIQAITEQVTKEVIEMISDTTVDSSGTLIAGFDGERGPLTVGRIKSFLRHGFVDQECSTENGIIVACGTKGADPHYAGRAADELKANQPIVLDIYPRSIHNRYWTDMTRTVVKGRASEEVKRMFETVLEAKKVSIDALHAGALGNDAYHTCCDVLEKAGYATPKQGLQPIKGFLHGLGHGVGLQIHEGPTLNELYRSALEDHNVVTVEPGLYDPDLGGVRIEDLVEVTKTGCTNLTRMEIELEI